MLYVLVCTNMAAALCLYEVIGLDQSEYENEPRYAVQHLHSLVQWERLLSDTVRVCTGLFSVTIPLTSWQWIDYSKINYLSQQVVWKCIQID